MMRALFPSLAFLSLFLFPFPLSALLMLSADIAVPISALLLGIFADILYYPGTGVPLATLLGGILSLVSFFVRWFVKARIMF